MTCSAAALGSSSRDASRQATLCQVRPSSPAAVIGLVAGVAHDLLGAGDNLRFVPDERGPGIGAPREHRPSAPGSSWRPSCGRRPRHTPRRSPPGPGDSAGGTSRPPLASRVLATCCRRPCCCCSSACRGRCRCCTSLAVGRVCSNRHPPRQSSSGSAGAPPVSALLDAMAALRFGAVRS